MGLETRNDASIAIMGMMIVGSFDLFTTVVIVERIMGSVLPLVEGSAGSST